MTILTVEQALEELLSKIKRLGSESVYLSEAVGRVLAKDVVADISLPSFDNSAVDGYAVIASDTANASPNHASVLQQIETIYAGANPEKKITNGFTSKIMTGAPLPEGANAVVMLEDSTESENNLIEIHTQVQAGQGVRKEGEDIQLASTPLCEGTLLHAGEIGILAALGQPKVNVVRRPRVAVVSTGDEVVEISQGVIPPKGKIRNSNRYLLSALTLQTGAALQSARHLPDELEPTMRGLKQCVESGADVIVVAGGVSVGEKDYVRPALEKLGKLDIWKVNMKPGKPIAIGSIGDTLFFGLPGNPVSAQVTWELFVRPALLKMMGRSNSQRMQVEALLESNISHSQGRTEYVRGKVRWRNGSFHVVPTGEQGSGMMHSLQDMNCLIVIPADETNVEKGSTVTVMILGDYL